jgi:uncharacterized protein YjdB
MYNAIFNMRLMIGGVAAALLTSLAACGDQSTVPETPPVPFTLSLSGPSAVDGKFENGAGECNYEMSVTAAGGRSGDKAEWLGGSLHWTKVGDTQTETDQLGLAEINNWFSVSSVATGQTLKATRRLAWNAPFQVRHQFRYRVGSDTRAAEYTITCNFQTGPTIATVAVSPNTANTTTGQTVKLTAVGRDGAGNAITGSSFAWTSSNTSVASVDASGLVTGVAPGNVTVTATAGGKSGTAQVSVTNPIASVTVSPASASVTAGQSTPLTATAKDAGGVVLSSRSFTWSSSNPSVASVNSSGVVSGVTSGTATITATAEGKSGTAQVTVTPAPVSNYKVTAVVTGAAGGSIQSLSPDGKIRCFKDSGQTGNYAGPGGACTATYPSGTKLRIQAFRGSADFRFTGWSSACTQAGTNDVCEVSINGDISIGAGFDHNTPPPALPASVTVTPGSANVAVGQTVQLSATVRDAGGNVLNGQLITWSSGNANVATVSSSGLVTGRGTGTVSISASTGGRVGSSTITVPPGGGSGTTCRQTVVWNTAFRPGDQTQWQALTFLPGLDIRVEVERTTSLTNGNYFYWVYFRNRYPQTLYVSTILTVEGTQPISATDRMSIPPNGGTKGTWFTRPVGVSPVYLLVRDVRVGTDTGSFYCT